MQFGGRDSLETFTLTLVTQRTTTTILNEIHYSTLFYSYFVELIAFSHSLPTNVFTNDAIFLQLSLTHKIHMSWQHFKIVESLNLFFLDKNIKI